MNTSLEVATRKPSRFPTDIPERSPDILPSQARLPAASRDLTRVGPMDAELLREYDERHTTWIAT